MPIFFHILLLQTVHISEALYIFLKYFLHIFGIFRRKGVLRWSILNQEEGRAPLVHPAIAVGAELLVGITPAAVTVKAKVRAPVGRLHKLHCHIAIAFLQAAPQLWRLSRCSVHWLHGHRHSLAHPRQVVVVSRSVLFELRDRLSRQVCRPPVHEELLDVTHVRTATLRDALAGE